MDSLNQIEKTLRVALKSEAMLSLVRTRLMIRTGVDLGKIDPKLDADPAAVQKVLTELKAMGYSPAALNIVAARGN